MILYEEMLDNILGNFLYWFLKISGNGIVIFQIF